MMTPAASVTRRSAAGSIRRRVVMGATAGLAVALVMAAFVLHFATGMVLRAEFTNEWATRARALAALATWDAGAGRVGIDLAAVAEVVSGDMGFQLWAPDGHLLAGDQDLGTWDPHMVGPVPGDLRIEPVRLDGHPALRLARRCRGPHQGTAGEGTLVAVVIGTTEVMDRHLDRLREILVVVVVGTLSLAVLVQTWILRRGLRPLGELAADIARRDHADGPLRFSDRPRPQELMPVAERLDDLMARITEVLERERRIGAAVAHELRTPLAGLRATLELPLIDPAASATERRRAATSLAIVEQLQRVLEALLMLARLDAGRVVPQSAPVDIGERLAAARDAVDAAARERRLAWHWSVPVGAIVATDRALLDLVLGNLLGNAVAHGNDGGDVAVELSVRGDAVLVRIGNSGSRIPAADAERVCERFWRGDAARGGTGEHCGLGLALCRDVLRVLHGTLAITTEQGGRFTVEVLLPRV